MFERLTQIARRAWSFRGHDGTGYRERVTPWFPHPATIEALDGIRQRLQAAENGGDADSIAAVMSNDIVLMVPNEPVQQGRSSCAAFVRRILDEQHAYFNRRITYVSDEVGGCGDMAFDRGRFEFTIVPKDEHRPGTSVKGKYLWLYGRAGDGSWLLRRAIHSLDDPPEGP